MAGQDGGAHLEEGLRYQMMGGDGLSAEERLEKYTGEVDWKYLRPHFKEGALVYVDPELDLREVGLAFLRDEKSRVEAWLGSGDLLKPGELHAQWWEQQESRFMAAVVQPFILIQPLGD